MQSCAMQSWVVLYAKLTVEAWCSMTAFDSMTFFDRQQFSMHSSGAASVCAVIHCVLS